MITVSGMKLAFSVPGLGGAISLLAANKAISATAVRMQVSPAGSTPSGNNVLCESFRSGVSVKHFGFQGLWCLDSHKCLNYMI